MMTAEEFYQWEKNSRDTIDVKRCYIDIAGDLVSGLLLSQIIYWFIPGEKGSKLRVMKENRLWLAKLRADWWEECRLTPKQVDRSLQILRGKGIIETKNFMFNGFRTLHIWLNVSLLITHINTTIQRERAVLTKGEDQNQPKGDSEVPEKGRPITEITSLTTTETTPKEPEGKPSPSSNNSKEIGIIFESMRAFYGYPDKTSIDPIPNHGKEGKAIKRLLVRGFTVEEILGCWMAKCQKAECFKSMVYVNEDIYIGKGVKQVDSDKFVKGRYGHLVRR